MTWDDEVTAERRRAREQVEREIAAALTRPSLPPELREKLDRLIAGERASASSSREIIQTENECAVAGYEFVAALLPYVQDAERLDWLEKEHPRVGLGEEGEVRLLSRSIAGELLASQPTFRAAIDAARATTPEETRSHEQ